MGNVQSIDGGEIHDLGRNDDLVRYLKEALKRAESGDVIGGVFIGEHADETYFEFSSGQFLTINMIGRLARWQHKFNVAVARDLD